VTSATTEELSRLVRRLTGVTEKQLAAARALDGEELAIQNQHRTDLLFELQVRLDSARPLDENARKVLAHDVDRLTLMEARLARVAGIVATALAPADLRQRPATYGRSGAVSER